MKQNLAFLRALHTIYINISGIWQKGHAACPKLINGFTQDLVYQEWLLANLI